MKKHASAARPRHSPFLLALSFSVALAGIGCTREIQDVAKTHPVPSGWKTVCIGPYLLDLPPDIQLGGANPKFNLSSGYSYNFQGFYGSNAHRGVRYGDVLLGGNPPDSAGMDRWKTPQF